MTFFNLPNEVKVNASTGKYVDTCGKDHKLPNIVFEVLTGLRVGQKVMIVDAEASNI